MSDNTQTPVASADLTGTLDYLYEEARWIFSRGWCHYRFQNQELRHEPLNFKQRIPMWDGGLDFWGHQWQPVWPTLVRLTIENRLDAARLVQAQFTAAKPGRRPSPTDLGPKVQAHYQDVRTNAVECLRFDLQCQFHSFQNQVCDLQRMLPRLTEEQRLTMAIYNTYSVHATPMFRYCVATEFGFHEVAASFEREALGEYAFQIAGYDQAWAASVPERLRQLTATILEEMRRQQAES